MNQNFHQRLLQQAQQVAYLQQQQQLSHNASAQLLPQRKIRRNFDVAQTQPSKDRDISSQSNPYGKRQKKKIVKSISQTGLNPLQTQAESTLVSKTRKESIQSKGGVLGSPLKLSSKLGTNIQVVMKPKLRQKESFSVENQPRENSGSRADQQWMNSFLNQDTQKANSRNLVQQANTTSAASSENISFYRHVGIKAASPEKMKTSTKLKQHTQAVVRMTSKQVMQQYGSSTHIKLKHSASTGQSLLGTNQDLNNSNSSQGLQSVKPVLTQQISLAKLNQPHFQLDRTLLQRLVQEQNTGTQQRQQRPPISRNNSSRNFTGEPILNIRTAKDINIYNNSFILTTAVPHSTQAQPQNQNQEFDSRRISSGSQQPLLTHGNHVGLPDSVSRNSNMQHSQSHQNHSSRSNSRPNGQSSIYNLSLQNVSQTTDHNNLTHNSGRVLKQPQAAQAAPNMNVKDQRRQQAMKRAYKIQDGVNASLQQVKSTISNPQIAKPNQTQHSKFFKKQNASVREEDPFKLAKELIQKKMFKEALGELMNCPSQDESHYLRGVCYLDSGDFLTQAKQHFAQCLSSTPDAYTMLALCEKKLGNQAAAFSLIDQCIQKYPSYSDAYLMKAQHLAHSQKFKLALAVYQTCVPQTSCRVNAGMGECYKMLKKYDQAIDHYSQAITEPTNSKVLGDLKFERGLVYFQQKNYTDSLRDFQEVLASDPQCIKVHFYVGKILSLGVQNDKSKVEDLMLHYQLCAKSEREDEEVYSGNALYQIAKLSIAQRKFHEAHFALSRACDNHFQSKRMTLLKDFVEGVVQLTKRKIKKAVQLLSDLIEILKEEDPLFAQALSYRAYGYVAIEKYEQALQDIKKVKKCCSSAPLENQISSETLYNKNLSKGILKMDHEDYLMASKFFSQAWKLFPKNKDAYLLQVISIVRSYTYSLYGYNIDQQIKYKKVLETKLFIDKAIANCYPLREPSLHFFRGLLLFQLHHFYESVQDFNQAIAIEEEITPMYYLARGRSYACMSLLNEAIDDISNALKLDETLQQGYVFRGRCAFLIGDTNLAFLDFQRLILSDPKNPTVHVQAGKLLMTTGAYQDAIKAFENADSIEITAESHYQKARCHIALNQLSEAVSMFYQCLEVCGEDVLLSVDYQLTEQLQELQTLSHEPSSSITRSTKLQASCNNFSDLIKLYESGKLDRIKKQDAPLSIKLIPNSDRIQIEKAILDDEMTLAQLEMEEADQPLPLSHSKSKMEELQGFPVVAKYFECVYGLREMYLYRAVAQVFLGRYKEAVSDFNRSEECAADDTLMFETTTSQGNGLDHISTAKYETTYNKLVCYLLLDDRSAAQESLAQLSEQAYVPSMILFQKEVKDFLDSGICPASNFTKIFDKPQLSDSFAPLNISKESQLQLCFGFPVLRPPNMIPSVDETVVQSEFSLKQIDAPMPEAPWLKRCAHQKINFHDQVQQTTTPGFFAPTSSLKQDDSHSLGVQDRIGIEFKNDLISSLVDSNGVNQEQHLFDAKCVHADCSNTLAKLGPYKQQESSSALDYYNEDQNEDDEQDSQSVSASVADSLVRMRLSAKGEPIAQTSKSSASATKPLLPVDRSQQRRYDATERQGRYDNQFRDSLVLQQQQMQEEARDPNGEGEDAEEDNSSTDFIKEPHGLDQGMLAGPQGKKRLRKVSNLSLSDFDHLASKRES